MSSHDLHRRLQAAREEIQALATGEAYSDEWRSWYSDTLALLRDAYGLTSQELEGFRAIRFEFEAPTRAAEETFHRLLPSLPPPRIPRASYFQQRLSEADEYLLTLLAGKTKTDS